MQTLQQHHLLSLSLSLGQSGTERATRFFSNNSGPLLAGGGEREMEMEMAMERTGRHAHDTGAQTGEHAYELRNQLCVLLLLVSVLVVNCCWCCQAK